MVVKIMVVGSRLGTHMATVITMRAMCWLRDATFAMATASSTALIRTNGQITSTMVNGSTTCEKARVTVTTTMRNSMWGPGRQTSAMALASSSHANKIDTRASGGTICAMARETRHHRMDLRILEPGVKIRSMGRER